jgi:peptidoglycan/xylan/chitin deacetylase (PgdA/CDA1 family)
MQRFYKTIRNKIPSTYNSTLTKLIYKYSDKPYVKKDSVKGQKFPAGEKGGLILSADFELAWAYRFSKESDDPYSHALEKARQERENMPILINLFEERTIPITWATVGHLFLKESRKEDFDWMEKIPHYDTRCIRFGNGEWFDNVPLSRWQDAPEWYAPDLVNNILQSIVKHEIGTHTFSHINFSDGICPPKVAEDEIRASIMAMQLYGIKPESICFPAGSWGNVPVLKKLGIKIYRRKINGLQLAYPYYDEHGLLVTLSTDAFDRIHQSWSASDYRFRYKKAIDKAIMTGTVAHFVFHPSMDPWMITEVMDWVTDYAVQLRNRGLLWVGTMAGIARYINGNKIYN